MPESPWFESWGAELELEKVQGVCHNIFRCIAIFTYAETMMSLEMDETLDFDWENTFLGMSEVKA